MTTLRLIIVGGILVALAASHIGAVQYGRNMILSKLKDDRIEILKDGKRIDAEVLGADDDTLCSFLGGCLPDESAD